MSNAFKSSVRMLISRSMNSKKADSGMGMGLIYEKGKAEENVTYMKETKHQLLALKRKMEREKKSLDKKIIDADKKLRDLEENQEKNKDEK